MEKIFCQDIEDSEFARLDDSEKDSEFVAVESKTYFQDAWGRFKKNKLALVSLVFMAVVILFAVFAPMFSPYTYDGQDLTCRNALPNAAHWFGTDKFGRDIFVRIMYGARISLSVGFAAALLNLVIGVAYGAICGYFGGKVDMILMRLVDIIYSVPTLLYVIFHAACYWNKQLGWYGASCKRTDFDIEGAGVRIGCLCNRCKQEAYYV